MENDKSSLEKCLLYTRRPIHRYGQDLDPDQQTAICRNYCDKAKLTVEGEYCDNSRLISDTGELVRLLFFLCERPDIKHIVVADGGYLIHPLRSGRVAELVTPQDLIDVEIIDGTTGLRKSFNDTCREIRFAKAKRISDSMKHHAKSGRLMGKPPVGYCSITIKELRKDEKSKETVATALTMKIYSMAKDQEILKWCHENNLMINLDTLRKMFLNPVYCGRIRTGATNSELSEGQHEGYITYEEFQDLQDIIESERKGLD